jgi:hypothetical protein
MDDFTTYGKTYDETLNNLEKVLKRCQEHNISLIHEKIFIMRIPWIVLVNFVSSEGVQVDPDKIEIISTLPIS